jgi:hypothetical protein
MYSTALMPQAGQNDVAVSGWVPVGGNVPVPINAHQFHTTANLPMTTMGYQYPLVPNTLAGIAAAPINMGAGVTGNNFYSAWPPDKSRTYGVDNFSFDSCSFFSKFNQQCIRSEFCFLSDRTRSAPPIPSAKFSLRAYIKAALRTDPA